MHCDGVNILALCVANRISLALCGDQSLENHPWEIGACLTLRDNAPTHLHTA